MDSEAGSLVEGTLLPLAYRGTYPGRWWGVPLPTLVPMPVPRPTYPWLPGYIGTYLHGYLPTWPHGTYLHAYLPVAIPLALPLHTQVPTPMAIYLGTYLRRYPHP